MDFSELYPVQLELDETLKKEIGGSLELRLRPSLQLQIRAQDIEPDVRVLRPRRLPRARGEQSVAVDHSYSFRRIWIAKGPHLRLTFRLKDADIALAHYGTQWLCGDHLVDYLVRGLSGATFWEQMGLCFSLSVVKGDVATDIGREIAIVVWFDERLRQFDKSGRLVQSGEPTAQTQRRQKRPPVASRPWDTKPPDGSPQGYLTEIGIDLALRGVGDASPSSDFTRRLAQQRESTDLASVRLAKLMNDGLKRMFSQNLATVSPSLFCPGYREDIADRSRWIGRIAASLVGILNRDQRPRGSSYESGQPGEDKIGSSFAAPEVGYLEARLWDLIQTTCFDSARAKRLQYFVDPLKSEQHEQVSEWAEGAMLLDEATEDEEWLLGAETEDEDEWLLDAGAEPVDSDSWSSGDMLLNPEYRQLRDEGNGASRQRWDDQDHEMLLDEYQSGVEGRSAFVSSSQNAPSDDEMLLM